MQDLLDKLFRYVDKESERLIKDLNTLLSQPSIASQNFGMAECAATLFSIMESLGIKVEMIPTSGYPVVYGEMITDTRLPTLAVYGHYDVQPPDPLDKWETQPFVPTLINGHIYARGATDDKGNLMAAIEAVGALAQIGGRFPVNVKLFFEGEEEIGSPSLPDFLKDNRSRLATSDAIIQCDRGIHESGRPQLFLGNKGVIHAEIELSGAKRDVHSSQAPIIPNPAWDLIRLLYSLKPDGLKIDIPGFYEKVVLPNPLELSLIRDIPFSIEDYLQDYGLDHLLIQGSPTEILTELLYKPTLNIQGLISGYVGPGSKTIVPATAKVKIDIRLVHAMTVVDTLIKIKDFLSTTLPGAEFRVSGSFEEYKLSPEHPVVRTAMESACLAYGREPVVWPMMEGSGPRHLFHKILGIPTFMIGLGAPFATANTHAPNENIGISHYLSGIKMMATLFALYGKRAVP